MKRPSRAAAVLTVLGLALLFWLGDRITESTREELAGNTGQLLPRITQLPQRWLADVTAHPLHFSVQRPDLIGGAVAAGLLFLVILYGITSRVNRRPGEEQGSAGWSSTRDMQPFTDKDPAHRLQLTATEALSTDTRKTQRNLNVLVMGGAGTGKTRGYLMPNLARLDMSTAVTDPKGEIIREIGPTLEERGYDVRTLNLIDLSRSHHFNPFRYFDEDTPETSVMQLAECIMTNTSGTEHKSGDAFWDRAERALLTALTAYVWATNADDDEHEASLADVVDLQKGMAASEESADSFESDVDLAFQAAREIVQEWREEGDHDDTETEKVMNVLDFACRQYRTFEQGAGETKKSIIISLGVRLAPLDMHSVRQIISDDTLDIDELGQRPMVLFLEIPDTHQTFRFLATLFWQSVFAQNIYLADHDPSGRLPRQLHFFLDEFANIGKIPNFPQLTATIRSRGISVSVIMQTLSQGKAMWQDEWPSVVGNCDSLLYLGGRETETHKWISEQLGDETIVTEETSRSYGATGSWTRANHLVKRSLMTPDEVGRMPNQLAILFIRGLKPFKSQKAKIML